MNNRQNGRRRGRGGQQVRNGQPNTNNQDRGNRIDNRARGNAAQLLEKYKNLAGEAQRQGDRVNTEYYLQFADHYFRVLSESRARFEEQRPADQRNQREYRDEFGQDEDGDGEGQRYDPSDANWGSDTGEDSHLQPPRQNDRRPDNRQQDGRQQDGRQQDPRQQDNRQQDTRQRDDRPRYEERPVEAAEGEEQPRFENERRPRRPRAPRANGANGNAEAHLQEELADKPFSERIEVDRLPQSLSAAAPVANDAAGETSEAEAPRRRRAPRRPRDEAVIEA